MNYLLDTNICIYIIKKYPEKVLKKLETILSDNDKNIIYLSTVTISELYYGVEKSSRPEKNLVALKGFLTPFKIINFDQKSAIEYGKIRSDLEKKGVVIGPYDLQIAAIAKAHDLTLVSNNTKEFKRVAALNLDNWG